ncbi:MAG: hypoxanthine phosphoribosyltransferase, partial [Methylococcales bacterium]|nr:hypoxanthine phosphoribosyltransferase [Methylococcales bacterium]
MRDLYQDVDHILLDAEQIQNRIVSLAQEIESDYQDANDLILLCVLKGAVLFTADLSRALKRPHSLEFMAISSYAGGTKSTGAVKLLLDLNVDIADKHILIVEDIVDSGRTL